MNTPHTPGKLVTHLGAEHERNWLKTEEGRHIAAAAAGPATDPKPWEANARRLAACWNAFDGIPTEAIEKVSISGLVGVARNAADFIGSLLDLEPDEATDALTNNGPNVEQTINVALAPFNTP